MPVPASADQIRTGVNQQPSGGTDYPFIAQDDLGWTFLDLYLAYTDDQCQFIPPFKLSVKPVTSSPIAFQVRILDYNSVVVYEGLTQTLSPWGSSRTICFSRSDTAVFRCTIKNSCFAELATGSWITSTAAIDPRVCNKIPKRVQKFVVNDSKSMVAHKLAGDIRFATGKNMEITIQTQPVEDGERRSVALTFSGVPGAGEGREPGCGETDRPLLTINNIQPTADGKFIIQTGNCHSQKYPGKGLNLGGEFADNKLDRHSIELLSDCDPCLKEEGVINTYMALTRVWRLWRILANDVKRVLTIQKRNLDRWKAAQDCMESTALRLTLIPEPEGRFFIGVSFCNVSDHCLDHAVLLLGMALVGGPSTVNWLEGYISINNGPEIPTTPGDSGHFGITTIKAGQTFVLRARVCVEEIANGGEGFFQVSAALAYPDGALGGGQAPPFVFTPPESAPTVPANAGVIRYFDMTWAPGDPKSAFNRRISCEGA